MSPTRPTRRPWRRTLSRPRSKEACRAQGPGLPYLLSNCFNRMAAAGGLFAVRHPSESPMAKLFARFMHDESAATAIEYGLIAAGISIAIIVAVNGLGSNLNGMFTSINGSLK